MYGHVWSCMVVLNEGVLSTRSNTAVRILTRARPRPVLALALALALIFILALALALALTLTSQTPL